MLVAEAVIFKMCVRNLYYMYLEVRL